MRAEAGRRGRSEAFEILKPHLVGNDGGLSYRAIGERLGTSEATARVTAHRLRRRFAELMRNEIAQTVATPDAVEDEIQHLLQVMAR
jgi:RNA polymerase sigma-70 factor (ECF subfamily)